MSAVICFACKLGFLVPTDSLQYKSEWKCTEGSLWAPKSQAYMQNKLRATCSILIRWDLNISDTDSQSTKTDVCLLTFAYCLQSTRHNTLLFYQIEPFRNGPFLVLLPVFLTINWQTKQTFLWIPVRKVPFNYFIQNKFQAPSKWIKVDNWDISKKSLTRIPKIFLFMVPMNP